MQNHHLTKESNHRRPPPVRSPKLFLPQATPPLFLTLNSCPSAVKSLIAESWMKPLHRPNGGLSRMDVNVNLSSSNGVPAGMLAADPMLLLELILNLNGREGRAVESKKARCGFLFGTINLAQDCCLEITKGIYKTSTAMPMEPNTSTSREDSIGVGWSEYYWVWYIKRMAPFFTTSHSQNQACMPVDGQSQSK